MRDIAIVLGRIMDAIPDDYEQKSDLGARFSHIIENSRYTAPELMWRNWSDAATALTVCVPMDASVDWKRKIGLYFSDKIKEEELFRET